MMDTNRFKSFKSLRNEFKDTHTTLEIVEMYRNQFKKRINTSEQEN
jgi:hypothetical protein